MIFAGDYKIHQFKHFQTVVIRDHYHDDDLNWLHVQVNKYSFSDSEASRGLENSQNFQIDSAFYYTGVCQKKPKKLWQR